jgi:hypothetical protein
MGRTIPSFRIAVVLEYDEWELFRKYLRNKNEKKLFTHMFLTVNLYNSACSNAVNPIRKHSIMMSIILHHYKMVKERISSFGGLDNSSNDDNNNYIYDYNNIDSTILKQEKTNGITFLLYCGKRIEYYLKKCNNHHTNIHHQ